MHNAITRRFRRQFAKIFVEIAGANPLVADKDRKQAGEITQARYPIFLLRIFRGPCYPFGEKWLQ